MRFCCGSNVKAAESLLRYVETFDLQAKHSNNEPFRRLWILMHFEARSAELHSIAGTIFNQVFLVKMGCENDFMSALKFLVERAASSSQSFLTKLKQVMIQGVRSKEETSLATGIIIKVQPRSNKCLYIYWWIRPKKVLNEACLGEALSRMQSLEKLEIDGMNSVAVAPTATPSRPRPTSASGQF